MNVTSVIYDNLCKVSMSLYAIFHILFQHSRVEIFSRVPCSCLWFACFQKDLKNTKKSTTRKEMNLPQFRSLCILNRSSVFERLYFIFNITLKERMTHIFRCCWSSQIHRRVYFPPRCCSTSTVVNADVSYASASRGEFYGGC